MKSLHLAIGTLLAAQIATNLQAQSGVVDLTALPDYANQTRPTYITRDNTPLNNPITDAGATLGRVLFHDKRLSRNDTVSCGSCHNQTRAFADTAVASTGVNGTTGRHAMRLINSRFGTETRFFWDERATSLENQTTQPIKDHTEMGFSGTSGDPSFTDLIAKLFAIPEYRVLFTMTYGNAAIDELKIQKALAQFVRSIQSFDSKYDIGRAVVLNDGQPFPNFTANENAGKQLFLGAPIQGGAGCAGCHRPPEFDIDPNSRNNGITVSINGGTDLTNTRSPSLRDLVGPNGESNGGLMHNGALTLNLVVNHYNAIPADNPNLDPRLRRPGGQVQNLGLTQIQRNNLVAFLRTLSGTSVYSAEKWSNPFGAAGELAVIVLPSTGMTVTNHGDGTATVSTTAATGLQYQLQSSHDLLTWTTIETLTPDKGGNLSRSVSTTTPSYYWFAFTPPTL